MPINVNCFCVIFNDEALQGSCNGQSCSIQTFLLGDDQRMIACCSITVIVSLIFSQHKMFMGICHKSEGIFHKALHVSIKQN